MKKWVDDHYYDFEEDAQLCQRLNTFVGMNFSFLFVDSMKGVLETSIDGLKKTMARKVDKIVRQSMLIPSGNVPASFPIDMKLLTSLGFSNFF